MESSDATELGMATSGIVDLQAATDVVHDRITTFPITGEVESCAGTVGWIWPHVKVEHPLASKNDGRVSICSDSLTNGTKRLRVGHLVQFHVFSNGSDLGAEECEVFGGDWPHPDGLEETEPDEAEPAAPSTSPQEASKTGIIGPGPRERITVVPTTGDLVSWHEGFAWIQPHSELDHPLARKRGGKIYLAKCDLAPGVTLLLPGQLVKFHIYADDSGLGAEECAPL